jgi:hypothetical protein
MGLDGRGSVTRRWTGGPSTAAVIAVVAAVWSMAGCGGADAGSAVTTVVTSTAPGVDEPDAPSFVDDVFAAIDAVEAELGAGQEFFEVTANAQFTNVFVAVDDATAAVAYAYVDGELQPPAPKQPGAEGLTFGREDVTFDPERVLSGARAELSESVVDAISVYGDGVGATYVLAATSPAGGFLDIVVGPEGQIFSVDPI